ncbi:MAG: UTP--glucose-1-phosphate uridylyltransferase [uncultured Sphingomonas sp.]|uniref:UTP--glucose-1-phosphate uridylyltransferase n=1 Tax=uncultured Sphingomonas sp. TaxID=158754 RepID=A0A6J4S2N1_9SPHN|nr:UTP--glucose-1-phosphate uridylyltransferase GalU [uncultured Sphingomonas sp.]CAA9488089.1 MAG: UTP--glucose-1-phosphate uridylyltransferase [uncultured Sphingomonas sp.]
MTDSFKPLRKAVFPVAGLGTRLLPATKTMPKEMLTVIDRPLIQYAVDEAREAGIEQLVFVTGRGKSSLVDYFDVSFELESTMRKKGKSLEALELSRADFGELISVRQQQPLGLGHAVWCARHVVGDEPFAVLLPDDLMAGTPGALAQMVEAYNRVGGNIVCAEEVAREKTGSYGIVTPGATNGNLTEVRGMVEKPAPDVAPSRLGVIGRYILQPEVMSVLDQQEPGAGGEIQLTDAMAKLIGQQPFHAVKVDAVRHDCGDKTGYVLATLALALERDDLAPTVREFLASR